MKKIFLFALMYFCFQSYCSAQNITTVLSKPNAAPPSVSGNVANAGDAVETIMFFLNTYASMKCSNKVGETLKPKIEEVQKRFTDVIPKGATAEFLVLTNRNDCTCVGIVQKTQKIHIKENACSVGDISLVEPALLYDPATTGFFTIKVKF